MRMSNLVTYVVMNIKTGKYYKYDVDRDDKWHDDPYTSSLNEAAIFQSHKDFVSDTVSEGMDEVQDYVPEEDYEHLRNIRITINPILFFKK